MEPYVFRELPIEGIDWISHIKSLGNANRALLKYDGILQHIPNQNILLSPLTTQEAVISSKIEGTHATFEDVLTYGTNIKKGFDSKQTNDIIEIANYRKAMQQGVDLLKYGPFNIDLIQQMHKILLTDSRGKDKEPGKIRTIQNIIGPDNDIRNAVFVPPKPEFVPAALQNWESYLSMKELDPLVQLAILKAQFELIHPFIDGNGRIGRMLVPLILYHKKVTSSPLFYISAFFEKNKLRYSVRLSAISQDSDWDGWIAFFLEAVTEQALDNCERANSFITLYELGSVEFLNKRRAHKVEIIFERL